MLNKYKVILQLKFINNFNLKYKIKLTMNIQNNNCYITFLSWILKLKLQLNICYTVLQLFYR